MQGNTKSTQTFVEHLKSSKRSKTLKVKFRTITVCIELRSKDRELFIFDYLISVVNQVLPRFFIKVNLLYSELVISSEHSFGSSNFPNSNLRQIGQVMLWQTNRQIEITSLYRRYQLVYQQIHPTNLQCRWKTPTFYIQSVPY